MAVYALPVFLANTGMGFLTSMDIVLVKRFFPAYQAGLYSAVSLTARTIFFAVSSMIPVMFSLVAERHAKNEDYRRIFRTSIYLSSAACVAAVSLYGAFPTAVIKFFFGAEYLEAAPYLGLFSVFISLYSVSFVLINYFLSLHQTKIVLLAIIASGVQALLITLFHTSLTVIIVESTLVALGLLLGLVFFYLKNDDKMSRKATLKVNQ